VGPTTSARIHINDTFDIVKNCPWVVDKLYTPQLPATDQTHLYLPVTWQTLEQRWQSSQSVAWAPE
jgi:hypothetical protein